MHNLKLTNYSGFPVVDSRDVADVTGKPHNDLMKAIRNYIEHLTKGNFPLSEFFIEDSYTDSTGRTLPCYLLTRKGCDMVANKMTGEKGIIFTATYVTKFEEMEKQIAAPQIKMSKELQAILMIDEKTEQLNERVDKLENDMPLFNVECKELQAVVKKVGTKIMGGYRSPAYKDNSLRGKVYSDIQHQLRREFGVERYEAIKRSQLGTAVEIVESYKAPLVLVGEIEATNNQLSM